MGTFEYIVSSQKRCVVKVVADGTGAVFSLTAPAWGGLTGFIEGNNEWSLPRANDIALSALFYGNGSTATILSFTGGDAGANSVAFMLPPNQAGQIAFERSAIPFANGGGNITGAQFSVTTTSPNGVYIMEFVR
jgi:hypothetical protein